MTLPSPYELHDWDRATDLSGIELAQDQPPTSTSDYVTPTDYIYQTFVLPGLFPRGNKTPNITGAHVCLEIADQNIAEVHYTLEYSTGNGWESMMTGTEFGSHAEGAHVWFEIYFPKSIKISDFLLTRAFRLGIKTTAKWWYNESGQLYRILTASADSGIDFLGNKFRSTVVRQEAKSINTNTSDENSYWLSKPNPSKFAVEALYFDVRDSDDRGTVVDRFLVDPITPGVDLHIYHSDEGDAEEDVQGWETKLWTPINQSYTLTRRQEFALPAPVTTKFIKVEFSRLQARYYQPGTFQNPIKYKKFPKWVLNFFLTDPRLTDDAFISQNIRVVYNALDLAYNYYLDDLRHEPTDPLPLTEDIDKSLTTKDDRSDEVDGVTLNAIDLRLAAYRDAIGTRGNNKGVLGQITGAMAELNYPVEYRIPGGAATSIVSTLDRENVLAELTHPTTYFYLICRHAYREVEATFEHDRAYFVGIREFAFLRDNYLVQTDTPLYVEGAGDETNVARNDFLIVDGTWQIYEDTDEA